jgi:ABC-type transport system substrate-binding protein
MGIDPDLYQIWHSTQTGPNQLNFVGYRNPEADDLIIRIRQEYDHGRQVAFCHRLHEIIARDQPYTFLYVGKWTAVLDKRIVILETDATGKQQIRQITPTKTGNYMFYFNRWIKLAETPQFSLE